MPYKGSSQAVTDLLAGQVDLLFTPASTVIPHVKAGKLKALGTIGHRRLAALPDVPTFAEARVPGFDSALWFGLNAPRGTPPAVSVRITPPGPSCEYAATVGIKPLGSVGISASSVR